MTLSNPLANGKLAGMDGPSQVAVAANSRGMAALRSGDFHAAALAFKEACAADPTAGALKRNLASAYRGAGDGPAELDALDGALAVDRLDLVAWMRKAELHQKRRDLGEALAAWSTALQLAQPLKPWSGPLSESLDAGQEFVNYAVEELRSAADAALVPLETKLNPTERRRGRAFVDMALGSRRAFTNECAGLFYPFLPPDEFFDEVHFPWFAEFAAATDAIRREVEALLANPGEALRPYVRMDKGLGENKWSLLDNKLNWGACFLYEYGEPHQEVLDRCPQTAKALSALPRSHIPGRAPNAFFSILQPRTRIPPHTGVTNTRAIVHLPLIVPKNCGFRVGGETREWVEGTPFAFDDTIEHEAWNDSDELRAVLICDVWNPHLTSAEQELVCEYYKAADSVGYNPARHA
jgi:aspartyl/asparaginyl beta-hydroxylase (cupin superfamily)